MAQDKEFFHGNRKRLKSELQNGVVVMNAYTALQLSGDMAVPFHQEANFWYLTGIDEPDWQLIMTPEKTWLVAPDVSDMQRVFDGGLSRDVAQRISGVDEVLTASEGKKLRGELAATYTTVYAVDHHPHQKYFSFTANPAPAKLWRQLTRQFDEVCDIRGILARLRAIKQPVEIEAITQAVRLTVDAFAEIKAQLTSLTHENEVEAEFTYRFRRRNANHAYDPIVAAGGNACTLHYATNSDKLTSTDLLLLDIGARHNGYPADITRTYSVGGAPTPRQRAVHAAVKTAHQKIIDLLRPGLLFAQYQDEVDVIMKHALQELDLLHTDTDYRRYFPHAISHGLGIDVHDSLGGYNELQQGMVLTVEPGIYIPEEGIGIRLEDDIVITATGRRNLSESLSLDL